MVRDQVNFHRPRRALPHMRNETLPHLALEAQPLLAPLGSPQNPARHERLTLLFAALCVACAIFSTPPALAAGHLQDYLTKAAPSEFFPGSDRFGALQGDPPVAPVYRGDQLQGFVYLNTDFTKAVGYSGKPINLLVGIDQKGVIGGIKLVEHKEPIFLIGIPEKRILNAINSLVGKNITPVASGAEHPPQIDIVSGATVTSLVINDSVVRSAVRLIRSGRITATNTSAPAAALAPATKTIDFGQNEIESWESLLADGSVQRLHLTIGQINDAFGRSGNEAAAANPEPGDPNDTFIDLYVALATVPTIGRSLLGADGYEQLKARLQPGQQAIIVAGTGVYSFKGSGYVRGGIFDRIELLQDGSSTRFRDRNHRRLGKLAATDAPDLPEISLFVTPEDFALDPTAPWQLELLVQRAIGAREKAFLSFDLGYTLPEKYLKREQPAVTVSESTSPEGSVPAPGAEASPGLLEEPLWRRMWRDNAASIAIVAIAIGALTLIFFFQNFLVRRPRLNVWVRRIYLLFILVWLGWYANAQLSVVNVLTFTSALVTGFSWEYFLTVPLIFILWAGVAASLLFWGRGPFCGWLCPFGALQELLNNLAKFLKIPQLRIPWGLHERLWPLKYIIFLGLFGLSLYSIGLAEQMSEVEPFKTAIILKFVRDWPFVLYAVLLLVIGLFIERFFCRYLCPLGAALAIPGRIRMFEWLKRWPECGRPCQRCANECPVQAIHPEGHINVNECIYCMHCQELYWDDQRCPHMIQLRLKRERREALTSPSMRS
jgi:NosR/NirI family nitrous oxide reductase transcriptional regulator